VFHVCLRPPLLQAAPAGLSPTGPDGPFLFAEYYSVTQQADQKRAESGKMRGTARRLFTVAFAGIKAGTVATADYGIPRMGACSFFTMTNNHTNMHRCWIMARRL
jgi:hypothetical protein